MYNRRRMRIQIAMRTPLLVVVLCSCATGPQTIVPVMPDVPSSLKVASESITAGELLAHIEVLASDEYEGRAPGTRGEELTIEYVAEQFRSARLKPGNPDGTFLQKVPVVGYTATPVFSIAGRGDTRTLRQPEDYVARSRWLVPLVDVESSGVVFVGYGIEAPGFGWDDYKNVDLRGKTLLMLEGEPRKASSGVQSGPPEPLFRETATYYGTRDHKYDVAAAKGAAAVLFVHDPQTSTVPFAVIQSRFARESFDLMPERQSERTAVDGWITGATFEQISADAGMDASELREGATRRDFMPVPLNATASIRVTTALRKFESHNVVALLEGSDERLKAEHVIYSAHWDHLGRDESLSGDQIHNGAIDNAAGVAQLLEIAEAFAALETAPRRSVLFIATTGEEFGFFGATHYITQPLHPLSEAVANINLDAGNVWGRTTDVNNMGFGLTTLDAVLAAAAERQKRTFLAEPFAGGRYFYLSDQFMFAKSGIPSVFPGPGDIYVDKPEGFGAQKWNDYGMNRYHAVSDEVEMDWDLSGAAEDARWLLDVGYVISQDDTAPSWNPNLEFRRPAGPSVSQESESPLPHRDAGP